MPHQVSTRGYRTECTGPSCESGDCKEVGTHVGNMNAHLCCSGYEKGGKCLREPPADPLPAGPPPAGPLPAGPPPSSCDPDGPRTGWHRSARWNIEGVKSTPEECHAVCSRRGYKFYTHNPKSGGGDDGCGCLNNSADTVCDLTLTETEKEWIRTWPVKADQLVEEVSNYTMFRGKNCYGPDYDVKVDIGDVTLQDCKDRCTNMKADCTGFVMNMNTDRCWLFKNDNFVNADACRGGGSKYYTFAKK